MNKNKTNIEELLKEAVETKEKVTYVICEYDVKKKAILGYVCELGSKYDYGIDDDLDEAISFNNYEVAKEIAKTYSEGASARLGADSALCVMSISQKILDVFKYFR